ncbi:Vgb family protein [Subtercola lobariae]|uniref:SMP-30/Gluconolactonase/LRE-like region domain-containing protein n=1 Tax=Subtercola lobariae TaxID=1588641 RepID=A0A917B7D3_9MICO|nr:hypothetical protein [Subtercola lobariae]GGF29212.1 hypothetical protein GCM10011399_22940 [Subtercola lobariae]
MKFRHALVIPVTAALIGASALAASAGVAVPAPPFATLPHGSQPLDVVTDSAHNVYVLSQNVPSSVTEYTSTGTLVHTFTLPASSGAVLDMTIDPSGMIYTANSDHTIGRINPTAVTLDAAWANVGVGHDPSVVHYDDASGMLYVADSNDAAFFRIDNEGGTILAPYAIGLGVTHVTDMTITPSGRIFATWIDTASIGHIAMIEPQAYPHAPIVESTYKLIGGGSFPTGIVSDSAGDIYIANHGSNNILEYDADGGGALVNTFALAAGTDPFRVAVDSSDNVYYSGSNTGTNESSIGFISAAGQLNLTPIAVLPLTTDPVGLTVESDSATLYAAGFGNSTLVQLALGATITSADPSATLQAGSTFSYTPTTSGLDPISFSSPNLPAGYTLNATTGAVTGTVGAAGTSVAFDLVPSNTFGAGTAQHIVIAAAAVTPTSPPPTQTPGGGGGSGTGGTGTGTGNGTSTVPPGSHLPKVSG